MQGRSILAVLLLSCLAACAARTPPLVTVFFNSSSAALDDGAGETIRQAAELARANPSAPVRVLGFAAPGTATGSADSNRTLAGARAQAVRDALIASGVPQSRVTLGERATVPFEQVPTESRRVEIVFGA